MKNFIKKHGITSLAITGVIFVIWTFFLGGLDILISSIDTKHVVIILLLFVFSLIAFIAMKVIASVKWWKVSDVWRKDIKIGDMAHLSTSDMGEDVEVIGVEDEYVIVKSRVHKARLYKPYK